jgi:ubiquinone/menaquinone biosynthesis C-methylase UbiE
MAKPDSDNIRFFYNEDASRYDERWSFPGGKYTAKTQYEIIDELCSSWKGLQVLEAGSGTGRFSTFLLSLGAVLTTVDLSPLMLQIAMKNLNDLERLRLRGNANASVYGLPFRENTFQAAISINVFNHLMYPFDALKELARVMVPGGELVVNFPNVYSYFFVPASIINAKQKALGKDVYSSWYKPKTILGLLHRTGYEIVHIKGHVHIPRWLDIPFLRSILRFADKSSRESWLSRYAPIWFIKCRNS